MQSIKTVMFLTLGAFALTPVLSRPAATQIVAEQPGFVAMTKSSVAGCPNIGWRLARHSDGTISGIAYYADASGASTVTGRVDSAGKSTLTLTSMMGKGPVGTVTGQRSQNGALEADLKGEGCANEHVSVAGVPNLGDTTGG